jgi:hypothetical protein
MENIIIPNVEKKNSFFGKIKIKSGVFFFPGFVNFVM